MHNPAELGVNRKQQMAVSSDDQGFKDFSEPRFEVLEPKLGSHTLARGATQFTAQPVIQKHLSQSFG